MGLVVTSSRLAVPAAAVQLLAEPLDGDVDPASAKPNDEVGRTSMAVVHVSRCQIDVAIVRRPTQKLARSHGRGQPANA